MRRPLTLVLVALVGALAALAVADALRSDGDRSTAAQVTTTADARPPTLRETLRREEITGFVVYSDRDCRLHSLLLPRLVDDVIRDDDGADIFRCRFGSAAGRIVDDDVVASPGGGKLARCERNHIAVWEAQTGAALASYRGCAPAWTPDGRLTYFGDGAIRQDGRVVFDQRELQETARAHPNVADLAPNVPFRARVVDLAWLDERRLAASLVFEVRNGLPETLAVLFDGHGISTVAARLGRPYRHWVTSGGGSFAASEDGTILARGGGSTDPPEDLPDGRAVAFSPDERWLAVVTGQSVYLLATPLNDDPGRIIRIPKAARDLTWEPVTSSTAQPAGR